MIEHRAELDAEMLKRLPKPPSRKLMASTLPEIIEWLGACAEQGGSAGLAWVFDPRNWPGSTQQRAGLFGRYAALMQHALEREKAADTGKYAAAETQARQRETRARKRKGWERHSDVR